MTKRRKEERVIEASKQATIEMDDECESGNMMVKSSHSWSSS
jgi:hypothetical protein